MKWLSRFLPQVRIPTAALVLVLATLVVVTLAGGAFAGSENYKY